MFICTDICIYNSYTCNLFCNLCAEDVHLLARLMIWYIHSPKY